MQKKIWREGGREETEKKKEGKADNLSPRPLWRVTRPKIFQMFDLVFRGLLQVFRDYAFHIYNL